MVRMEGLEPSRPFEHSDLNAACLPIPAHPHSINLQVRLTLVYRLLVRLYCRLQEGQC